MVLDGCVGMGLDDVKELLGGGDREPPLLPLDPPLGMF